VTNRPQLGKGGKIAVALSLTGVGGFVDAVGYIALFQIFTANMSGNSVHVGMFLGRLEVSDVMRPLCAIMAYATAIVLTGIAVEAAGRSGVKSVASFNLAAEALLLTFFATATPAIDRGQIVDLHSPCYFALVALLATAMGIQTATLSHVGPLTVYTTFVTGTITKFAESVAGVLVWVYDHYRLSGKTSDTFRLMPKQPEVRNAAFLASIWLCYVAGAAIGTITKSKWELRSLYLPVVVLVTLSVIDQWRPIDLQ